MGTVDGFIAKAGTNNGCRKSVMRFAGLVIGEITCWSLPPILAFLLDAVLLHKYEMYKRVFAYPVFVQVTSWLVQTFVYHLSPPRDPGF
jgi:hypothetical protein